MKRLITLISTKGKTAEESYKELMTNIRKYKKVAKQVEKEMGIKQTIITNTRIRE